jgi:hypothetical protein
MENTGSGVDWPVTLQVTQTGSGTAESNQPSNVITGTATTLGGIVGAGAHSAALAVSQSGTGTLVQVASGAGAHAALLEPTFSGDGVVINPQIVTGTGAASASISFSYDGNGLQLFPYDLGLVRAAQLSNAPTVLFAELVDLHAVLLCPMDAGLTVVSAEMSDAPEVLRAKLRTQRNLI